MKHLLLTAACVLTLGTLSSCTDETTDPGPTEFIATEADFVGYDSWEQTTEPRKGPDPGGAIGPAHAAGDTSVMRYIHISPTGAGRTNNGQYPIGTKLVKAMKDSTGAVMIVTAMAKRGNNFDASGNDWEYFMIDADGAILQRGTNLEGAPCKSCHSGASSMDYVFTRN